MFWNRKQTPQFDLEEAKHRSARRAALAESEQKRPVAFMTNHQQPVYASPWTLRHPHHLYDPVPVKPEDLPEFIRKRIA